MQVFTHDPLYRMALSSTTAKRRQQPGLPGLPGGDDEAGAAVSAEADRSSAPLRNADAERTVLRCRQKLEGREGGKQPSLPMLMTWGVY